MTLKEKFKTNLSINTDGEAGRFANQCELIADNYAIEFLEWISKLQFKEYSNGWGRIWYKGLYNTKELLEIFKKERGL